MSEYTERELKLLKHICTLTTAIGDALEELGNAHLDIGIWHTVNILQAGVNAVWETPEDNAVQNDADRV